MGSLDKATVVVIGANGFLGRHLLERLSQSQAKLHAVSRSAPVNPGKARWWQGSAADARWTSDLLAQVRPDVIYQLASASVGGQESQFVLPTFENDLRTTVNTLLAARDLGCGRVIITRSLDEPSSCGGPHGASSPYAAAKAASGIYGRMFHSLYAVPVVMLRPFMTYGPGQKDHKVIPYTIQCMLGGQSPRLSSGTRRVDWIYVDDVISAFIAAATSAEAIGTEIDLGSGSLSTIRDVVSKIQQLIPGAPDASFGSLPDRVNEAVRHADLRAAQAALKWVPTTSLESGLSQMIEWCRQRRHLGLGGLDNAVVVS